MVLRSRLVARSVLLPLSVYTTLMFCQSKPGAPTSAVYLEFPVTMRQNVKAGTTRVGTKVEANLTLATLVDRTVIPEGARFSGEVVESEAKSPNGPSRLVVRMDSVMWKKGSASVKVYLTAWYYPTRIQPDERDADPVPGDEQRVSPGRNRRFNPNMPSSVVPALKDPDVTARPFSVSNARVPMKDIESMRDGGGAVALTSSRSNIKLDKSTTYVLATGDVKPAK